MGKIRVGVMRGGPSSEYEISLLTGGEVLRHIPKDKFTAHDILISRDGVWHIDGFPQAPNKLLDKLDVVFNALHGEFGEDGKVQQILESFKIPYTGSGILPSAMCISKSISKNVFSKAGLQTARSVLFKKDTQNIPEMTYETRTKLFPPWVVKPNSRGSSVGVTIARTIPELQKSIENSFDYDNEILIEEFIEGREATCGVLENFRNQDLYALPVVEIIPPPGNFFDYQVKYNGATREICPGNFSRGISDKIQSIAVAAHKALGLKHYSRADFIVSSDKHREGIYILEVNSLPGLTSQSLLPKAAESIGLSFSNLIDHLITLAKS
ncbi:D-alanine--D-alanine ligase [Candidatus Giovannonibacteria bacterium]|nr:D-alanine--D-alanine ligase [Candidatus Giovannonibacteria bacterium]